MKAGGRSEDDAMRSYERPYDEALELKDRIAFYWNKMERRYEEVFVHLRDPCVRIDVLASSPFRLREARGSDACGYLPTSAALQGRPSCPLLHTGGRRGDRPSGSVSVGDRLPI
ncbi:MAG: hypothetical protein J4F40_06310 [Alphaproteobacteria bacterium]|nr:hypothetical protein [Alphaproteobacteria bacterium]